ncbi:MAG: hypothetical protein KF862_06270 [Chitinophagaceae bacterium]|nr:hypothetical protein [Chitinophagaceae bacterium]
MALIPSISNLHLRYRLWIAELNFDINVLRIFSDHLHEVLQHSRETGPQGLIASFEKRFADLRGEIDELKNDMHLTKMQLASYSREKEQPEYSSVTDEMHALLARRYQALREKLDALKKDVDAV